MVVAVKAKTHTGDDAGEKRCAVCRKERPRAEMLRFVSAPGEALLWDARERAPGRGVRVCASRACLDKRKLWTPAFATALESWLMDQLGIYMRKHRIVLGADATQNALGLHEVSLVLVASDVAERTRKNVSDVVERLNAGRGEAADWVRAMDGLSEALTREQREAERKQQPTREVSLVILSSTMQRLGRALGRDEVGVVALAKSAGATVKDGSLAARAALLAKGGS